MMDWGRFLGLRGREGAEPCSEQNPGLEGRRAVLRVEGSSWAGNIGAPTNPFYRLGRESEVLVASFLNTPCCSLHPGVEGLHCQ